MQGLQQLGWVDGRNVRIDIRWATTNAAEIRRHAVELVALAPDVILAATDTATVEPRFRHEPGTAGRQRDWVHDFRIWHGGKMAGAGQSGARLLGRKLKPASCTTSGARPPRPQAEAGAIGAERQEPTFACECIE